MNDYYSPSRLRYKVKPNQYFDEGTYAYLEDDYSDKAVVCGEHNKTCGLGLFTGIKNGKEKEEVCSFCEFEEPIQ